MHLFFNLTIDFSFYLLTAIWIDEISFFFFYLLCLVMIAFKYSTVCRDSFKYQPVFFYFIYSWISFSIWFCLPFLWIGYCTLFSWKAALWLSDESFTFVHMQLPFLADSIKLLKGKTANHAVICLQVLWMANDDLCKDPIR